MIKLDRYTIFVPADVGDFMESNLEARGMAPNEIAVLDTDARCFEIYGFRGILRRRKIATELRELVHALLPLTATPGEQILVYRESIVQVAPERRLHA